MSRNLSTRRRLARDLMWAVAAKVALLSLIWASFFSGKHQPTADPAATGRQLAVAAAAAPARGVKRRRTSESLSD